MRISPFFAFLLATLVGCRSPAVPATEAELREPDAASLVAAFVRGDNEAEARLAAAGPDGAAAVRPLLLSPDENLRLRSLEVLLSAGEDIALTERERVELALFEITRPDVQPWGALRGFGRLREHGAATLPALREAAASGEDMRAKAARRLLLEWVP